MFIVWVYRIVNPVIMFQCSLFLYVVYIFTLLYAEFNGNGFGQSHYFSMPCLFARGLCLVFFLVIHLRQARIFTAVLSVGLFIVQNGPN